MIFVSGTSSVVGHETTHEGDVIAQLDETLLNLEKIVAAAASRTGRMATLDDFVNGFGVYRGPELIERFRNANMCPGGVTGRAMVAVRISAANPPVPLRESRMRYGDCGE